MCLDPLLCVIQQFIRHIPQVSDLIAGDMPLQRLCPNVRQPRHRIFHRLFPTLAVRLEAGHLFAKGFTALAFMNYLCFFYDFPIPLCVASMLRI
jgi:hypothetical protein